MLREFCWLGPSAVPAWCDLRRCGWGLVDPGQTAPQAPPVALLHTGLAASGDSLARLDANGQAQRRATLLLGITRTADRARALKAGYADALCPGASLDEIDARAGRVRETLNLLPAERWLGTLRLDMRARDGFSGTRAVGLHPREFALIWRLADSPGETVTKPQLIGDVWRMGFVPETNSLAVHIFRLRAKLATAGYADLVQTDADGGGYRLAMPDAAVPVIARRAAAGLDMVLS